jgi:carboxypeptidase C (cathepsin A)
VNQSGRKGQQGLRQSRGCLPRRLLGLTAAALLAAFAAGAQERPSSAPKAESSVTQHSLSIGGRSISYTATAGTLLVRNERDEVTASIGYVAYVERDGGEAGRRPITFAFNGGPGSSSVWLHMGALGPRRIVIPDAGPSLPPPYQVVDNAYSLLDKSDLVMIDPVGTGLSHAMGEAKDKDFWGVDPDIESVSRFIAQYVDDNNRWGSPKYLLGESYGTTRAAGVVEYLQTRSNMAFNGVILISVALNFETFFPLTGNDTSYPLALPSLAATAWYHHALPRRPAQLEPFLDEVRGFALGEYASALLKGNALSDAERDAVAERIHQYTGLSADFVKKANLRVRASQFAQELRRDEHVTLGILDSRFTGPSFDALGEDADYDPLSAATGAPFTAAFLDYLHSDLKFGQGKTYTILNEQIGGLWDFRHRVPGLPFPNPLPNTASDLAHALGYNPSLRVLTLSGIYDLATPFLATEWMMSHLPIEKAQQSHIQRRTFEAGHMMYLHEPSLKQLKEALSAFFDQTSRDAARRP